MAYSTTDETLSRLGLDLTTIRQLNLKKLNIAFTLTATDNESKELKYSYLVSTNKEITNETTGWSEWQTSNLINIIDVNQFDGNNYYLAFRVKDEAGNISNISVYELPTYLNAADNTKYYDLSNPTLYRLPILDSCSGKTLTASLYYGTTVISAANSKFCLSECPEGYNEYQDECVTTCPANTVLNNGVCEEM
jgi:hypothetical protein